MYVAMAKLAKESAADSAETVVFQFFNLIKVAGFRLAEYAQTTQTKVVEFEYVSGNKVIKAFMHTNWKFYDGKGRLITTHSLDSTLCKWAGKLQESIYEQPKKDNFQDTKELAEWTVNNICGGRQASSYLSSPIGI